MLAPLYSAILANYYQRTYGAQLSVRLGSVLLIAGLTVWLRVWSLPWAACWGVTYFTCEWAMSNWWRGVQPGLRSQDETGIVGVNGQLMVRSALLSNIGALPCLVMAYHGGPNAAFGLLMAAGCLLILTSQNSLDHLMFVFTAPVTAVGLVWNAYALGHGASAWVYAGLACITVANAFNLHTGNSSSFNDQVKTQLEAEVANKTKRLFLANMGHEIRTPLNGVLGMAQVMGLNDLSGDQRERLDVIRTSGETLLSLLNDLLDYSKIEAGKVDLEDIEFDLAGCIDSACQGPAILAAEKGLTLNVDTVRVSGLYRGDPVRVRQIVQNLVSNAIKFTRIGSVTVTATVFQGRISIAVIDTGVGISEDQIARLFNEFVQADQSTTRRFGGTGLGLAICRDLAKLMGGDIRVDSEVGRGSRFVADLPLAYVGEVPVEPVAAAAAPVVIGAEDDIRIRVLVAEDNAANQFVLKSLLAHTNADAEFVENGALALEAFELSAWDLVLMDVQMPVMDGITATQEIRRREAADGRPRTPIYALTADAMSHQIASHRAAGMDGHIAKPIQIAQLFEVVAQITSRKAAAEPPAAPLYAEAG